MTNRLETMNNRQYSTRHTIKVKTGLDPYTTIERWKDIKGFSNYQVSSLGRIRKNRYTDRDNNVRKPKIISQVLNKNGYYYVTLIDTEGKHHFKIVHRLVAAAFCGRPKEKAKVRHIDGNMTNNNADNLRWNAPVEIDEEKVKKQSSGWRKSVVQIDAKTGEIIATYKSQIEAAKAVGVSQSNLSRAVRWNIMAGGFYWRYIINKSKNNYYEPQD